MCALVTGVQTCALPICERTRRIQGLLSAVRRGARNAAHCVIVVMTAPYLRVVVPCGAVQKQPDPTRSRAKLCHRDTAPVAANRVAVRAENNGVHCCMNDSSEAAISRRKLERSEEH